MVSPCPLLLYQGGVWRLQSAVRTEMLGDAWSGGLLSMVLSPTGKWKLAIPFVNLSSAVNTHQLNPHERDFDFLAVILKFFDGWGAAARTHGGQNQHRGHLTGAVARLCVERCRPSRERCLIFVLGRRVRRNVFICFIFSRPGEEKISCTLLPSSLLEGRPTALWKCSNSLAKAVINGPPE